MPTTTSPSPLVAGRGIASFFTSLRREWRHSLGHGGSALDILGLVIVVVLLVTAVVGPLIAPEVLTSDIANARQAPSAAHWFGTDDQGRDIFWRVVVGTRTTLSAAVVVVILYSIVGVAIATLGVLAPRWLGDLVMRAVDVMQAFPSLIFALLIAALMGPSLMSSIVALAATGWVVTARLVAGIMRSTLHEPYVEAARTLGVSTRALMFRHVFPNALPTLRVKWAGDLGTTILLIGSMSFIGAGAQPPSVEWGAMVIAAKDSVTTAWWGAFFPGVAIAVASMGFALLGDAINHRQNSRVRGH